MKSLKLSVKNVTVILGMKRVMTQTLLLAWIVSLCIEREANMNWYELASAAEVKEILEKLLHDYDFVKIDYEQESWNGDPIRVEILPKEGYEIAEALWGEHSEELF
jgi:hypothetical protein